MADPLTIPVQDAAGASPAVYTVPGSVTIEPLAAFAHFDGTSASGAFLPCLSFYSSAGLLLARVFPEGGLAAGASADVTFSPALTGSAGDTATPYKLISANSTNSTLVHAGTTRLASYFVSNQNASARFVKLYDKATAPTVGTDVPKWTIAIPGGSAANLSFAEPILFVLGLGIGTTTGVADADTGAVAATEVVVNLGYF